MNTPEETRQQRFLALTDEHKGIIVKVCSSYALESHSFADLYQEVMANIWQGMESFRGEARMSTWIYRVALNTCIALHRSHRRHNVSAVGLDVAAELAAPEGADTARVHQLYEIIGRLEPVDRALILLWLDDRSYDEISDVMGFTKSNVATRLHRAKRQLASMAKDFIE